MSGTSAFWIRRPSSQIVDVAAPLNGTNPAAEAAAVVVAHPCLIAGLTGAGEGNQPTPHTCTRGILTESTVWCGGAPSCSQRMENTCFLSDEMYWSFNMHKVVLFQSHLTGMARWPPMVCSCYLLRVVGAAGLRAGQS